MAVNKVDINLNRRLGQPGATADTGITWRTIDRPSVAEYKDGMIRKSVITVPSFSFTTTAAAKGIGQLVYTFPEGFILPVAARIEMNSTAADNATAGEVGLGTTVASGAVAVLSGTAGFQNLMDGKTLSNHTAATALTTRKTAAGGGTSGTQDVLDGSATAEPLYFNIASTWGGTGGVVVNSATITVWWIDLGDA